MFQSLRLVINWTSLARLSEYRVNAMAKLVSLNLREIERHFHDVMKMKLAEYVHHVRMHDGQILVQSDLRIFEISTLLGYHRPEHFTRALKHFGRSPTAIRSSSVDHSLKASVFLSQYCELLEEKAADTADAGERKHLRARIPYGS
jgi:transcriptional regulator GlxA family with amidase domain